MRYNTLVFFLLFASFGLSAKDKSNGFFIKNDGQWTNKFDYKSNINGGAIFFTKHSLVYNLYDEHQVEEIHHDAHDNPNARSKKVDFHSFQFNFVGANTSEIQGEKKLSYYQNYYLGKNKTSWKSKVPTYEQITYKNIYQDIDLSYFITEHNLKYEFYVSPGANTNNIKLQLKGANASLNNTGDLIIHTSLGDQKELKPYCYQLVDGKKVEIISQFKLNGQTLSFEFPNGYNKQKELVIDPVLIFATYSGGTSMTFGWSAAYDQLGKLYSGGECFGVGWPVTLGSFQQAFGGGIDVGVNVYNPTGTALVYSTYLGGSGTDLPSSMICNKHNELIIAGTTGSTNFPTLAGAYSTTVAGSNDIFITAFDVAGTAILGSTYIGGSGNDGSSNHEVNVDDDCNIYLASSTSSSNFPTTMGAFQTTLGGSQDGILVKMDSTCSNLMRSTYLGGSSSDMCLSILRKPNGEIVTCGSTSSINYPTSAGSLHATAPGGSDGFVSILDSTFGSIVSSTYVGTTNSDMAYRIQVDAADNVYVCGTSDGNIYPISPLVYSNAGGRIFLDKLNPNLSSSLLSTRIGSPSTSSTSFIRPTAFLLDVCGNIYVSSQGASAGLPLTSDAYSTTVGGFWISVLTPNFAGQLYGTYLGSSGDHIDGGGSRFDPIGIIYQSICTSSPSTYNSTGGWSPANQSSSWDIASIKMEFGYSAVVADFNTSPGDTACTNEAVQFLSNAVSANSYDWNFGDGAVDTGINVTHTYTQPGTYTVTLIAENTGLCTSKDTAYKTVLILDKIKPIVSASDLTACTKDPLELLLNVSNLNSDMSISWTPSSAIISGGNTTTPLVDVNQSTSYTAQVIYDAGLGHCQDTSSQTINITLGDTTQMAVHPTDTTICEGSSINLVAIGGDTYDWKPADDIIDPTLSIVNVTPKSPESYAVTITDIYGCSATKHVSIETERADAKAGRDRIIKRGRGIELLGQGSSGTIFEWDADPTLQNRFTLTPWVNPIKNTMYYLTAKTDLGCTDRDSAFVKVTNAIVPNAFSPNGDNKNDIFKIIWATEDVKVKTFSVYNRWGQNIFATQDLLQGWDGTFRGEPCPIGAYYYIIVYTIDSEKFTMKGDLTLVR